MKETGAGRKVVAIGWCQGGGSTIAAAGQAEYIARTGIARDGIDVVGHFALVPEDVAATDPDKLKLTDLFTEEGVQALDEVFSNKCIHTSADTISDTFGKDFGKLMRNDPQNSLAWAKAIQDISVPNDVKPAAPVMIYFGNNDTTLQPIQHELYRKKMCAIAGANVGRMQLPGDQNHFSTPAASEQFDLPWIADRFAGKPAADGCAINSEEGTVHRSSGQPGWRLAFLCCVTQMRRPPGSFSGAAQDCLMFH